MIWPPLKIAPRLYHGGYIMRLYHTLVVILRQHENWLDR